MVVFFCDFGWGIYTKSWIDSWINRQISYFVGYSLVSNNNSLLSNKPLHIKEKRVVSSSGPST